MALRNVGTGELFGPFFAASGVGNHSPQAFQGRFPCQVRLDRFNYKVVERPVPPRRPPPPSDATASTPA